MVKETDKILKKRWEKKKKSIHNFFQNYNRLKRKINKDLSYGDDKDFLTALIILVMLKTSERVGNSFSSFENGHYGVTEFEKSHVEIYDKGLVVFEYKGKSGVDHFKLVQDKRLSRYLIIAIEESPKEQIFVTSDGFKISPNRVNRYLSQFDMTAKDIRGFSANKMMYEKLKKINPEETEHKRKIQFNKIAQEVAQNVGHGSATLQKHYLIPEIKTKFVDGGTVLRLEKKHYL